MRDKVSLDTAILKVVQDIFTNSVFEVETINEALLVELMALRGLPIKGYTSIRDTRVDLNMCWHELNIESLTVPMPLPEPPV